MNRAGLLARASLTLPVGHVCLQELNYSGSSAGSLASTYLARRAGLLASASLGMLAGHVCLQESARRAGLLGSLSFLASRDLG